MKVYFPIGAFYPSQIGGPCNTLFWHTCALKSKGLVVDITTTKLGLTDGDVEFDRVLEEECGSIYYGSNSGISGRIIRQIFLGVGSADIVHLNSLFNILSIACFFYIKSFSLKKKIIWSVRGELNPNALKFSRIRKQFLLFLYRRMIGDVLFHTTSEKESEELKAFFPNVRVVELPNFIKPSVRIQLKKKKQFLYLGRIHPIKAIHKLISGISLSKRFVQAGFRLIIVGGYEDRHYNYYEEILRLIQSKCLQDIVEFRGHLIGDEKEKIYAESYSLILPSETENFGNVVVEALNQGTPVIASKGTPWSILEKYQCGFHISNRPEEIADAIDLMIDLSIDSYIKMTENSLLLVDREFNVTTKIDKWIDIYKC